MEPAPDTGAISGANGVRASSSNATPTNSGYTAASVHENRRSDGYPAEAEARDSSHNAAGNPEPLNGRAGLEDWDWKRFRRRSMICEAPRNRGRVELVEDHHLGQLVAVKAMPVSWVHDSVEQFRAAHPKENEIPWCDMAATCHLSRVAQLPCICRYIGVYFRRCVVDDPPAVPEGTATASGSTAPAPVCPASSQGTVQSEDEVCMVMSYCSGGDLFSWLERSLVGGHNGHCRETPARPLLHKLFTAVARVHSKGLAHGDLSLENVLLDDPQGLNVMLIDFGASTGPRASGVRGKPSYQAPELHTGAEYDAFSADAFSLGVLAFTLVVGDYPWTSTRHLFCAKFKFYAQKGLTAYLSRRQVKSKDGQLRTLAQILSPEVIALLDGLLRVDPLSRLDVASALSHDWFQALGHEPGDEADFSRTRTRTPPRERAMNNGY